MTSGENSDVEDRILKRIFIVSKLEKIIEESVYYRTHSENFSKQKIIIGTIKDTSNSIKIL